jgi:hypothetical protein
VGIRLISGFADTAVDTLCRHERLIVSEPFSLVSAIQSNKFLDAENVEQVLGNVDSQTGKRLLHVLGSSHLWVAIFDEENTTIKHMRGGVAERSLIVGDQIVELSGKILLHLWIGADLAEVHVTDKFAEKGLITADPWLLCQCI